MKRAIFIERRCIECGEPFIADSACGWKCDVCKSGKTILPVKRGWAARQEVSEDEKNEV